MYLYTDWKRGVQIWRTPDGDIEVPLDEDDRCAEEADGKDHQEDDR